MNVDMYSYRLCAFLFLFRLGKVLLAISVIDYCLRAFWSMPTNQSITCWSSSHTYLTSGICWWALPPKPCREMLRSVVYSLMSLYIYAYWLSSLKSGETSHFYQLIYSNFSEHDQNSASHLRNAWREFNYICHKDPLGFMDELIRVWVWTEMHVNCNTAGWQSFFN